MKVVNFEYLSKHTILANNYMYNFPINTFSLADNTASTYPGKLPHHSLVLQTSQPFHRPSVSTMQKLYCMMLSSGQTDFMIRSATLLVFKMILTSHKF